MVFLYVVVVNFSVVPQCPVVVVVVEQPAQSAPVHGIAVAARLHVVTVKLKLVQPVQQLMLV